jgi:hypothetical protein
VDLAWAAGLFEGEGCLFDRAKTSGAAKIQMTDLDVLERFARIIGFGRVLSDTEPRGARRKIMHYWQVQNTADTIKLIELLGPWFGERRRKRADELLERMAKCPGRPGSRTHCPEGHEYDEANTYMHYGKRRCRACHREQVRLSQQAKRKAA